MDTIFLPTTLEIKFFGQGKRSINSDKYTFLMVSLIINSSKPLLTVSTSGNSGSLI